MNDEREQRPTDRRTGSQQARPGNDNARARRTPETKPSRPAPAWLRRARADFRRDAYTRSSRNWTTDMTTGRASERGRGIGVDPKAPDFLKPIFVDVPGQPRQWAATAVEARNLVERGIRQADDAEYHARLRREAGQ